jgi:spore maturation protein CgeB
MEIALRPGSRRRRTGAEWQRGWKDGYALGAKDGYFKGRCEAIAQLAAQQTFGFWDVHVLYVTSGKGYPYSPLDHAIYNALTQLAAKVSTIRPDELRLETLPQPHPQLLLALDGLEMPTAEIERIRESGVKTAVWFGDDPYYLDLTREIALHYDHVFTLDQNSVAEYQKAGAAQVHFMPFAADTSVFRPLRVDYRQQLDICFIGSAFWNRVRFFDEIAGYLKKKKLLISGIWWKRLKHYHALKPKIRLGTWMSPENTALIYNRAKIVINLHRSHDDDSYNYNREKIPATTPNPRTFEICGSGALQLTDMRADLPQFYVPGEEIVVYENPADLVEKIEYYLQNEEERQRIAMKGLYRTHWGQTYRHRLSSLLTQIFGDPSATGQPTSQA